MNDKLNKFLESKKFQNLIITLIIINSIILGMETSQYLMSNYGYILKALDSLILKIFILEIILKLISYKHRFFLRPWCIFDFIIIAIALIPATGAFSALRALRILRVLRLISTVKSMRKVIEGLITAIPGIASVATIMILLFYIFAVIGTHLYSPTFPEWFGSLGKTMFTLFQVMTLESWSMGIVRPVMEQHDTAWIFFISYILVTTFTMLNLFIAIIVNAMHSGEEDTSSIKKELKDMEKRLTKLIEKN